MSQCLNVSMSQCLNVSMSQGRKVQPCANLGFWVRAELIGRAGLL
jgi:hypothetical protein